jgi:hypothetical protein
MPAGGSGWGAATRRIVDACAGFVLGSRHRFRPSRQSGWVDELHYGKAEATYECRADFSCVLD